MEKRLNLILRLMELNKLFIKEVEVLGDKIENTTGARPNIGSLLYSLTRQLENDEMLSMTDKEMIDHVRKTQQFETEN